MIGGYFIAATNNALDVLNDAKSIRAATVPTIVPTQLPKDLFLKHTNDVGLTLHPDTIRDTIPLEIRHDTIHVVKYKTRWKKKEVLPDTILAESKPDTTKSVPLDTIRISRPTLIIPLNPIINQEDSL